MYYQHNNHIKINNENILYVLEYKKQLLINITSFLNKIDVKYVIGHGNLIEIIRGEHILHDDDLDIRICNNDIYKIHKYFKDNKNSTIVNEFNLIFDGRILDEYKKLFLDNGVQCKIYKYDNIYDMDIHCDVVPAIAKSNFWLNYNIDYDNLRVKKYLQIDVYIPNNNDTIKVLKKQYNNYIKPDLKYDLYLTDETKKHIKANY